jgi:hypothetical protein
LRDLSHTLRECALDDSNEDILIHHREYGKHLFEVEDPDIFRASLSKELLIEAILI